MLAVCRQLALLRLQPIEHCLLVPGKETERGLNERSSCLGS